MPDANNKTFEEWLERAAAGDADAQYSLGVTYRDGQLLDKDDTEAAKWIRMAAEQGHASAQSDLGVMYMGGAGVTQDYAEALKWTRMAADQGIAPAQCNLGVIYAGGYGVAQDDDEAAKWFELAADQGHAYAQERLDPVVEKFAEFDNGSTSTSESAGCSSLAFLIVPLLGTAIYLFFTELRSAETIYIWLAIGVLFAVALVIGILQSLASKSYTTGDDMNDTEE